MRKLILFTFFFLTLSCLAQEKTSLLGDATTPGQYFKRASVLYLTGATIAIATPIIFNALQKNNPDVIENNKDLYYTCYGAAILCSIFGTIDIWCAGNKMEKDRKASLSIAVTQENTPGLVFRF